MKIGKGKAPQVVIKVDSGKFRFEMLALANEVKRVPRGKTGSWFTITLDEYRQTTRADGEVRANAEISDLYKYVSSELAKKLKDKTTKVMPVQVGIDKDQKQVVIQSMLEGEETDDTGE
jgi:hypothetical protein